jgi:hypothetical protein
MGVGAGAVLAFFSSAAAGVDLWIDLLGQAGGGLVTDATVSGAYAYVADFRDGLRILDVSNPRTPTWLGSYDTTGPGWEAVCKGSYAYLADYKDGLVIVDISDPGAPTGVGSSLQAAGAYGLRVAGGYAYVASISQGLRIVDVSNPAAPELVGAHAMRMAQRVDLAGSYAYLVGTDGLEIFDVRTPTAPTRVGGWSSPYDSRDVAVAGTYAYTAEVHPGPISIAILRIIDISNPAAPSLVGSYEKAGRGYGGYGVAVLGSHAFLAAGAAGLHIIDVSQPSDPVLVSAHEGTVDGFGISVQAPHVYIADNLARGVFIFAFGPLGDTNCDGAVDFGDVNPFVLALNDIEAYGRAYPGCSPRSADCNNDGTLDFGDINPFVELLSGN